MSPGRLRDARRNRGTLAPILFMENGANRAAGGNFGQHVPRAVGRAVVDDDDLHGTRRRKFARDPIP